MSGFVHFHVAGIPVPQGSKRAFRNPHTGRIAQVESSKRLPTWRSDVRDAAAAAMSGQRLMPGPVELKVHFDFPRPKAHLRTNGELKPSAPRLLGGGPDLDKLIRGIADALTSVVWFDDRQIVRIEASKGYIEPEWEAPGCDVYVTEDPDE